jgi:plasmid stabilization system protein ParE
MRGYVVSPKADEDIFEIWRYVDERAGIEVAIRVEAEI